MFNLFGEAKLAPQNAGKVDFGLQLWIGLNIELHFQVQRPKISRFRYFFRYVYTFEIEVDGMFKTLLRKRQDFVHSCSDFTMKKIGRPLCLIFLYYQTPYCSPSLKREKKVSESLKNWASVLQDSRYVLHVSRMLI